MFTLYLKTGETVQVELDNLKAYLDENRDQIKVQKKKMGKRRADVTNQVSSK